MQNSIVKALRVVKHVNSGTIEPVTTMRDNHSVTTATATATVTVMPPCCTCRHEPWHPSRRPVPARYQHQHKTH